MTEEKKAEEKAPEANASEEKKAAPKTDAPASGPRNDRGGRGRGGRDNRGGRGGRGGRGKRRRDDRQQDEFDSKIVDLARVTRVMAGGKRMSFRACVIIGDKKGRIGMGVKKGADVQLAVQKATDYAKKHLITVPVIDGTIPHHVEKKFKGARVMLKPAKAGTGVIAGGPVRIALEMAGVKNVVAKMKGSNNKVNNLAAVLEALEDLRSEDEIKKIQQN